MLFAQYGYAIEDRNPLEHYLGAGMTYTGPLDGRDHDILGLGVALAVFSDSLPDQTQETAIELFYRASVGDHLTLQPDLQFIANPNGDGRDAFVFGLRFEAAM